MNTAPSAARGRERARVWALWLAAVLLAATVVAPAVPEALASGDRGLVTADALPTVQTDGTVWSVEVVGDTAYAVGNFDHARPPGTQPGDPAEVPRRGILAFDVRTGELLPFNPTISGTAFTSTGNHRAFCDSVGTNRWECDAPFRVKASPDGRRIYIGGDFTHVNGQPRYYIAAFATATGALVPGFRPTMDRPVRGLAVSDTTVYAGGMFTGVNGEPRERLAAFSTGGQLLPWQPRTDGTVRALTLAPDNSRVVVGGDYDRINGASIRGLAAVDATTGANTPWSSRSIPKDSRGRAYVTDLVTAGAHVYVAVNGEGSGVFDGRLAADPYTGDIRWTSDCLGATWGIAVMRDVVYSASHAHDCSVIGGFPEVTPRWYHRVLAETVDPAITDTKGRPAPELLHYFPNTNHGPADSVFKQGPWTVATSGTYVVYGGEFTTVNGRPQQGLTRFGPPDKAPNASGPEFPLHPPTLSSTSPGVVRVAWRATWDRDDPELRYDVLRDGSSTPIGTLTARSNFWTLPGLSFLDTTARPGGTHTYRIRATDPDGNTIRTLTSAPVTVQSQALSSAYATRLLADGAAPYWRLGDPSGPTAADAAGSAPLTLGSGVVPGSVGAIRNDPDRAMRFNGAGAGTSHSPGPVPAPSSYSIETWFATTTTDGGKLIGFGNSATGNSTIYDRHLYMEDGGRLRFGVQTGSTLRTITSPNSYRDGAWHHVVASYDQSGMRLYVDGALVASSSTATQPRRYNGYWRVGGDNLSGWSSRPRSDRFAGVLDEVAVYQVPLTASQVRAHHRQEPFVNAAPVARATVSCVELTCSFDGTGSTDDDGAIAAYSWAYAGGATASGPRVSRTFPSAGGTPVVLTVTDDRGATATTTVTATPTAPPPPPPAPGPVTAADSFQREVAGGWGTADSGGPWSVLHRSQDFSVSGGAGRMLMPVSGATRTAWLAETRSTTSDVTVDVAMDKLVSHGAGWLYILGRQVETNTGYRGRVRILPNGSVRLAVVQRLNSGSDVILGSDRLVPGLTAPAGTPLRMRLQTTGTDPTTLRAKVWAVGTPEPGWQIEVTDSAPALQQPGHVGLSSYISSIAENAPHTATWRNLGGAPG
jgi:hypothetical protein